ncbi:MAG TPA: hypothetical protein VGZ48_02235 [Candidatus Acidoferrales bacterium]|nr:hypothetical protein [Candidatus Acidoferrales bacterium]
MTAPEIGPLSLGEILDRMFFIYKRNFFVLVLTYGIPVILMIPLLILTIAGFSFSVIAPPSDRSVEATFLLFFFLVLFICVGTVLGWLATTSAVWEIQMGGKPTIRSSYAKAWKRLGTGLVSFFLGVMAFFMGYLLLIVPGILIGLAISLTAPTLTVEKLGPVASMERSWALSKGYRWRIFVTALICYAMTAAMGYAVMIPAMVVLPATIASGGTIPVWLFVVFGVAYALAVILPAPLLAIALCLIYYDSRVRKEGFDLQRMIDTLAPPPSVSPQAPIAG